MASGAAWYRLRRQPVNERRFITLFAAASFAHIVLDAGTTLLAVHYAGGYELNPFLRPYLRAGAVPFLLAHFPLVGMSIGGAAGLLYCLRRAKPPWNRRLSRFGQAGFAIACVWGLAVSLGNLSVFI